MKTIEEIRELIVKEHGLEHHKGDFGEILCYHIHETSMPFRILAEHFGITLDELAEVVADHIRRL